MIQRNKVVNECPKALINRFPESPAVGAGKASHQQNAVWMAVSTQQVTGNVEAIHTHEDPTVNGRSQQVRREMN